MAQERTVMVFISGGSIGEIKTVMSRMHAEHRKGNPHRPMAPWLLYAELGADTAAYRLEYMLRLQHREALGFDEVHLYGDTIEKEQWPDVIYADRNRIPVVGITEAVRCQLEYLRRSFSRKCFTPRALAL